MIFACSYSLLPWIVTPSGARETVPEMNNISPTRRALDHRPGGGSGTWALVIFSIFIVSSFIQINRITSAKIDPQSSTRQAKAKKLADNNCVFRRLRDRGPQGTFAGTGRANRIRMLPTRRCKLRSNLAWQVSSIHEPMILHLNVSVHHLTNPGFDLVVWRTTHGAKNCISIRPLSIDHRIW